MRSRSDGSVRRCGCSAIVRSVSVCRRAERYGEAFAGKGCGLPPLTLCRIAGRAGEAVGAWVEPPIDRGALCLLAELLVGPAAVLTEFDEGLAVVDEFQVAEHHGLGHVWP